MIKGISIRPARFQDLNTIRQWVLVESMTSDLSEIILDQCLLVAHTNQDLLGAIALDSDMQTLSLMVASNDLAGMRVAAPLITAAERLAVRYGIMTIHALPTAGISSLLGASGYSIDPDDESIMRRSLKRRRTRYYRKISTLLDGLGIGRDYARQHRMPLQAETTRLQSIGEDLYAREQFLLPAAARAWNRMHQSAQQDGIILQPVSCFRSVEYQLGIVNRKLSRGQEISEILKVSAAPGFSEHHTGRAIDVTTPGFDVLEEVFENSPAFEWLTQNAGMYRFKLSFPRNNRHRLAFEPWHWAWS